MKDLDAVKDSLMDLCTPGGCDALTLEVSHLHDLCVFSEKEMRERLSVCEARLSEIDLRLAGRAQILREQAESLLDELRAQDHSLGFLVGSQNISQLQENWHRFKVLWEYVNYSMFSWSVLKLKRKSVYPNLRPTIFLLNYFLIDM